SHGGEGDCAEGEVEIGGGRDDGCVVATELKDGACEAGGEAWGNGAAHRGASGCGDERNEWRVDELLADGGIADEEGGETFWGEAMYFRELFCCSFEDSLCGQCGERGVFAGLSY